MASKRIREASSTSSSSALKKIRGARSSFTFTSRWNYDVFLSFRGEDTRHNFTNRLYTALDQKGIRTFRDDNELRRGEDIASELLTAIEQSRISIIVFSRNYASSRWCLDELVKIIQCKKMIGQMVLPVFYDVNPLDVQKQSGSFAEAFARHNERFKDEMDKVKRWKSALTEAANLSGWDLRNVDNEHESTFIQRIIRDVFTKLNQMQSKVAVYQVGIDSRVQDINFLLNVGLEDVRIVGIYGMGGIGKTTIAKALYNLIFHKFDGSSFLSNVGEISKQCNGLLHLQKQLLSDVLNEKEVAISNPDRGIDVIKERLCSKNVLIVLDDVDRLDQLNALAGSPDWFGLGSRIVIITRDVHLLNVFEVDAKYVVEVLNHNESLQLFSWHAFGKDHPIEDFLELSNDVVGYAEGLPLALEVLGSFLFDKRSIPEWKSELEKLKRIPNGHILDKLKISYDALDRNQKVVFLEIAFFFIGMNIDYAIRILDACGLFPEIDIRVLVHRSLVTIDGDKLRIHDLLRDMGRDIVMQESPEEPGKRSRLWFHEDIHYLLTKNKGTKAVEGLTLNSPQLDGLNLRTEAFANMENLRVLQVNNVQLTGGFEHRFKELFPFLRGQQLFKKLKWLCWHGFNLEYIPTNFHLENLVILDMQGSSIRQVWKGFKSLKELKVLNLSNSHCLTRTPDFLGLPSLERLMLEGCTSLVEVHKSIGHLDNLVFLNLKDCKNLYNLPSSICELKSLKDLILSGCSKLHKLPKDFLGLPSLERLMLENCTSLVEVHQTIGHLNKLVYLNLKNCKNLCNLPRNICELKSLEDLVLSGCSKLNLPEDLGNVECLRKLLADEIAIKQLPQSNGNLKNLESLSLSGSKGPSSKSLISFFWSMGSPRKSLDSIIPLWVLSRVCSF